MTANPGETPPAANKELESGKKLSEMDTAILELAQTETPASAAHQFKELAKKYGVGVGDIRATFREFKAELKREVREAKLQAELQKRQERYERQPESPDEVLTRMNALYAVVNYSGSALIVEKQRDPVLKSTYLDFYKPSDFRIFEGNRFLTIPAGESFKEISHAEFWLRHEQRREYKGIIFSPEKDHDGYLNQWQGYQVKPVKGSCERYKSHIFEVICNSDNDKFDFLWRYLAHIFQRPCEIPEISIVMRGVQGTGKDLAMKPLSSILGDHFIAVTQNGQLAGRFNAHLMNALVVFANEAVWGGISKVREASRP